MGGVIPDSSLVPSAHMRRRDMGRQAKRPAWLICGLLFLHLTPPTRGLVLQPLQTYFSCAQLARTSAFRSLQALGPRATGGGYSGGRRRLGSPAAGGGKGVNGKVSRRWRRVDHVQGGGSRKGSIQRRGGGDGPFSAEAAVNQSSGRRKGIFSLARKGVRLDGDEGSDPLLSRHSETQGKGPCWWRRKSANALLALSLMLLIYSPVRPAEAMWGGSSSTTTTPALVREHDGSRSGRGSQLRRRLANARRSAGWSSASDAQAPSKGPKGAELTRRGADTATRLASVMGFKNKGGGEAVSSSTAGSATAPLYVTVNSGWATQLGSLLNFIVRSIIVTALLVNGLTAFAMAFEERRKKDEDSSSPTSKKLDVDVNVAKADMQLRVIKMNQVWLNAALEKADKRRFFLLSLWDYAMLVGPVRKQEARMRVLEALQKKIEEDKKALQKSFGEKSDKRFKDIVGVDEAKAELEEIVMYLKNPDKFSRLGGKLPKGILLLGEPGTGKTLLARATAGEAGVPFCAKAGTDFDEMYVGVGPKRMRELFAEAKQVAPCIVFIDEIDAVGSQRKSAQNAKHMETLNQLLVEMDGFKQNEGVIVMAATNFPESLDTALTRPGRLDRHISVPLPDVRGRRQILTLYTEDKPLSEDVDLDMLARGTPSMSGAALANLVNQAAVQASKLDLESIDMATLEWAKDKILMGTERKSAVISKETLKNTAYHEAGHALVAVLTEGSHPIHKATIMPRGQALGMVTQVPDGDQTSETKQQLTAYLDICMSGRVAEEMVFGEEFVTTGASSDLRQANQLARNMVTRYGMCDAMGKVYLDGATDSGSLSEETRRKADLEVSKLLNSAYGRASKLLKREEQKLHSLAQALLEYETLSGAEIKQLVKTGQPISRPGWTAKAERGEEDPLLAKVFVRPEVEEEGQTKPTEEEEGGGQQPQLAGGGGGGGGGAEGMKLGKMEMQAEKTEKEEGEMKQLDDMELLELELELDKREREADELLKEVQHREKELHKLRKRQSRRAWWSSWVPWL